MDRQRLLLVGLAALIVLTGLGIGGFYLFGKPGAEPTPEAGQSVTPHPTYTPTADVASSGGVQPSPTLGTAGQLAAAGNAPGMAPTQGGDFVQAVSKDAELFNPVLTANSTSEGVIDKLYPRLVGQDPNSGFIVPSELAKRWEISDNGRVYTFYLRDNIQWSDGQPVTANDFKFTYEALANDQAQSPYRDRTAAIERIETPDSTTVVITLRRPDCTLLQNLRRPLLPSHLYAADFSDLRSNAENTAPTVSAGPFRFVTHKAGEQIVLARNPGFWKGPARMDRWILRIIPQPADRWQQLVSGAVDLVQLSADEIDAASIKAAPNVSVYEYKDNGFSFMALNLANPANPQPGFDSAGQPVVQDSHPILGDLAVRQAIAQGIDYDRLINDAYKGHGYRLASYVLPTASWAYAASLAPYAFNPQQARNLLEGAGWTDTNGDGIRDKNGKPLQLSLLTNTDNPERVRVAQLVKEQLAQLGLQIQFIPQSFQQVTDALLGQRFDMAVIGWDNISADPGISTFWQSREDIPGAGYNFTSFHDDQVDAWLDQAAQLPGCGLDARGTLYRQVQQKVYAGLPYVFISGKVSAWAYANRWHGIAPGPWGLEYNAQEWWLAAAH